jgi:dihydropyrimidine dehydrogenase (NAD+) subunit PreA
MKPVDDFFEAMPVELPLSLGVGSADVATGEVDLSINLGGIGSPNPFWLASAPPTNSAYQVLKAFEAGWGGVVWKTLTNSPIVNVSSRYGALAWKNNAMMGFNNIELISEKTVVQNCKEMSVVKRDFPQRAVVASLMFESQQEWQDAVKACEQAGVDGFELNFGCPHGMCERGMGSVVGQNPELIERITNWVAAVATKPVLVKLTPNVTDITVGALAAQRGGANGLSLINTINSVIGVDLETLTPQPNVGGYSTHGGYCGPAVKPVALHMVSQLAMHPDITIPISGIGGIETWQDATEFMALGATGVQVATAVMHHGFGIVSLLISGLTNYLRQKQLKQVGSLVGVASQKLVPWQQLDLNYQVKAHIDATTCIGCQLCYVACDEGAHQAIALPMAPSESRVPRIIEEACVGCHLCSYVCPVNNCITMHPVDKPDESPLPWVKHPLNVSS